MPLLPGFTSFDEDPFFDGHQQRMREFSNWSPFGWTGARQEQLQPEALPSTSSQPAAQPNQGEIARSFGNYQRDNLFSPFRCQDLFRDLSQQVNHMMQRMDTLSDRLANSPAYEPAGDTHTYNQSSVYSYKHSGESEPHVYEAHHSTRTAPGGLREEKKVLRDTERNLEKFSLGRHIKDKGHVMERTTNTHTNKTHHNQNLYGLHESEVEQFKNDWKKATSGNGRQHRLEEPQRKQEAIKDSKAKL